VEIGQPTKSGGDSAKHGQQPAGPIFPTFALAAENNFSFSTANASVPPMQGFLGDGSSWGGINHTDVMLHLSAHRRFSFHLRKKSRFERRMKTAL
jgi:hypothetical protein